MRYDVRVIGGHHDETGIEACGQTLSSHDDYAVAKQAAGKAAYDFHYGVAVVDTEAQRIDWGSEWTDYSGNYIEAS